MMIMLLGYYIHKSSFYESIPSANDVIVEAELIDELEIPLKLF